MSLKVLVHAAGASALLGVCSASFAQDHGDHAKHEAQDAAEKKVTKKIIHKTEGNAAGHADHNAQMSHDMSGAGSTLEAYRDALVALDLEAAGVLFAKDSLIFENGKAEGSWDDYAKLHLGPELGHFHSFSFPTYELELRQEGHFAFGVERYTYEIELHDGRIVGREGVATSVLKHSSDGWKIIRYHSSSRAPRR